jgi:S-adenosylmethionine:tRNA ribosyltransferase-isomerase
LETKDFDFYLSDELIAQTPLKNRDGSRLLILDKKTGEIEHNYFYNIIDFLNPCDSYTLLHTTG